MKKSLWIAVAAMAVGFGMSAHAATNASFGTWTFEGFADGTPMATVSNTAGYGSWSADTNNGVAYVTNVASPAAGPNALFFDGSVTNHFSSSVLNQKRYHTEFLLKPGQLEDTSLLNNVDASARLAFFFNTSSNFVLMHGNNGSWQTSTNAMEFGSNDWVSVVIDQDYTVVDDNGACMFTVYLNGTNLTHANGYTRSGATFAAGGATPAWFEMKSSGSSGNYGMNSLVGMGIGLLDDVENSEYSSGAATFAVKVSWNSAYGSIVPNAGVVITNGTPMTFTLTANSGIAAYVSGLNLDAQVMQSNGNQDIKTQNWAIAYADVAAYGTNVMALFAAKSDTTAQWLTDTFTIGNGGDYATFAAAEAGDFDGDGFSNLEESIAGTDPTNNASYLKINDITIDGSGNVVVTFDGSSAGASDDYQLFAADLVNGSYASVATTNKVAGPIDFNVAPVDAKKFYKVVLPYTGE